VLKNDLQINTLELLLHTVTEALKSLETVEQSREERNRLRLEVHAYKLKVKDEYKRCKRRSEEEMLIHILQYAW